MLWYLIFACILCSVSGYTFTRNGIKCDVKDSKCVAGIVRDLFTAALPGIDELGVVSLDPLHQPLIEEKLADLQYSLKDSVVTGFKDCIINEVTISPKERKMHFDFTLPHFEMIGNYKVNGNILKMAVEGEGEYYCNATNIHMIVDVRKDYYEKDGKLYVKIVDIKTKTEPLGSVYLDVDNLFGGNKEKSEPVVKFIRDHPKAMVHLWENSVALANMNIVFDDFNKILTTIPLTDLVSNENV